MELGHNEITTHLDVKLDIKERKSEFCEYRNWTRGLVKVEAIKCFPCYVKITFLRNVNDLKCNLVIKINLPGLNVQLATSRTKQYAYGLFWKNHRKRCTIFFAFDSKLDCDHHMGWMKKSIDNLELHRREILETRRISRLEESLSKSLDSSIDELAPYQNINNTQIMIRDLKDILGPLPDVPLINNDINWSRRISGFSGIYEEINDSTTESQYGNKSLPRRLSRVSAGSGIYEEMNPLIPIFREPPPLPPRQRVLTIGGTEKNLDPIASKKRTCIVMNTIALYRSSNHKDGDCRKLRGLRKRKKCYKSPENYHRLTSDLKSNFDELIIPDKRNSYSSPDLTKANLYSNDPFDGIDDVFDLTETTSNSNSLININKNLDTSSSSSSISDRRQSVGEKDLSLKRSIMDEPIPNQRVLIDDLTGYCRMDPIMKTRNDNFLITKTIKDINCSLNFQRGSGNFGAIHEELNAALNDLVISSKLSNNEKTHIGKLPEAHLMSMGVKMHIDHTDEIRDDHNKKYNRNSIDEKCPSYLPNSVPTNNCQRSSPKNIIRNRTKSTGNYRYNENILLPAPQRNSYRNLYRKVESPSNFRNNFNNNGPKSNIYSVQKSEIISKNDESLLNDDSIINNSKINCQQDIQPNDKPFITFTDVENIHEFKTPTQSPQQINNQINRNYATINVDRSIDQTVKNNDLSGSIKRFASLPRFRRIYFSPLKMKINNVLQRHNSENF